MSTNVQVEKSLLTMYNNTQKSGGLIWLSNYKEVMLHIWDYVFDEEHKFVEAQGQAFDEDAFMLD